MSIFNIHISGVGGQGIGLLSEAILRAADHAGHVVKAVDTHGLAQRGGMVVSQVRLGEAAHSPIIPDGEADLAVALERHEAMRAIGSALRAGGVLVYYDTAWQPLPVRQGTAPAISGAALSDAAGKRDIRVIGVFRDGLADVRMQNIVLLAAVCRHRLIPGLEKGHYRSAVEDLMTGRLLAENLALFDEETDASNRKP